MPIAPRLASLAEVATRTKVRTDFEFLLNDFLDGFYAHPAADKLRDEPRLLKEILPDEGEVDAYLGAIAEHLAMKYQLPVPPWSAHSTRILKKPWFAYSTYEGRMFLLVQSPAAFRARNLFVAADTLSRV